MLPIDLSVALALALVLVLVLTLMMVYRWCTAPGIPGIHVGAFLGSGLESVIYVMLVLVNKLCATCTSLILTKPHPIWYK